MNIYRVYVCFPDLCKEHGSREKNTEDVFYMARTKRIPPEELLSDLEYTSVIVNYSNGKTIPEHFTGK